MSIWLSIVSNVISNGRLEVSHFMILVAHIDSQCLNVSGIAPASSRFEVIYTAKNTSPIVQIIGARLDFESHRMAMSGVICKEGCLWWADGLP